MRRALPLAIVAAGVWAAAGLASGGKPAVVVPAGAPLQRVLDAVPTGMRVVLGPGDHRGPLAIERRLTLTGEKGARLVAPSSTPAVLTVGANGTRVEGLALSGGETGVLVREANGVSLTDLAVRDAALHGIEVVDASALIRGADVSGLGDPYAQGIEIRNADGRPDSVVRSSRVAGGQEGIVSHVSEVLIEDNVVVDTTMRAIAVTEMSVGRVDSNRISGARGVGLYCGDMSRCEFTNNLVDEVAPGDGGRSSAGWGLVVNYHASASTNGDELAGAAGAASTFISSHITLRSPLEPGLGTGAAIPWSITTGVAVGGLVLLAAAAHRFMPRLGRGTESLKAAKIAGPVLIAGAVVQSFHMLEHVVQAWRVYVDGVPSRGSLVGSVIDTEWVHFTYNAAVLALFITVLALRRRWRPPGRARAGDAVLAAGIAIQSYHLVEHTAKVIQHVITGAKVNPGLAGGTVDLVWLHFGINIAVYVAFVAANVLYLRSGRSSSAPAASPQVV